MNVCILTTSLRKKSGPNNVIYNLVKEWVSLGCEVTIISVKPFSKEESERFKDLSSLYSLELENKASLISAIKKYIRLIERFNFDIINSHGLIPDIINKLSSNKDTPPVISTLHNHPKKDYAFNYGWFQGSIMAFIHKVVLSNENVITVSKEGADYLSSKATFIPNGVLSLNYNKVYSSCSKKTKLVFCGHMNSRKDPKTFLDACKILIRSGMDLEVKILGDGDLRQELQNLYPEFEFFGFVKHSDVINHYLDADIFVMSSKAEGMPMAMLEALSVGLPVVVSNIPSLSYLIDNYNIGRSFGVGNASECAEAIKYVVEHYELYEPKNEFDRHFSSEIMAKRYLDYFSNLLDVK
ncbi:glycosyltransferase family 4 protein [Vibrio sp. Vb1554]|uniref:glycosyltransferase family 4 protein n=1 Tax=Vibrio sp. Vb1554 TaxID=3074642 RepID=UPI0029666F5F|nr:glycosyltransferase family 4 protein [Vibrio sp. Vb1554]MDW3048656.1 glycosyltransferase family 4 protein [Vibrio sp. Vb1554]